MILYFIGRLSTLGCQKRYENILRYENIFNDTTAFFASIGLGFLVLTVVLYAIIVLQQLCSENNNSNENEVILNDFVFLMVKNVDSNLVGIILILYMDIVSGLGFSSEILFFGFDYMPNPLEYDASYIEKVHLYVPIILNVSFVFILNYYCNIIAKKK